jgi:predicted adenine nucleotide alpha hydrolase (AANH) superfamily ATPase
MVEAMVTAGHDVTIFFYNPNIHPRKEYELRIGSMIALEDTLTGPDDP